MAAHDAARGQTLAAHELLLAVDAGDAAPPQVAGSLTLREPGIVSPAPIPLSVLGVGGRLWLLRTLQSGAADRTEISVYAGASAPASGSLLRFSAEGRHRSAAIDEARNLVSLVTVDAARGQVMLRVLDPKAAPPQVGAAVLEARRGCGGPLALRGSLAAYADSCSRRLQLLDLTAPGNPQLLAALPLDVAAANLAWQGDRIVLAG